MSLEAALQGACRAIGIRPPRRTKPGHWVACPVEGKAASNGAGRVLIFDDGRGGICWNHITGQQQRFTAKGLANPEELRAPKRDPQAERLER